jgi:glycosyltransferase involved in cell wall biosynthesis
MNFAIYFAGDAYSTANKIMGRQSAGKAMLSGVAATWPNGVVLAVGLGGSSAAQELDNQLRADGFAGQLNWSPLPSLQGAIDAGALYYPAPPSKELAAARNLISPTACSLMGVTHTLSSTGAMDQISDCVFPPFKPWDALICTSAAAHRFVTKLHDEVRDYWQRETGASRFVDLQLPVIPLGVDAPAFVSSAVNRANARESLGLSADDTAFLFAGRLSFHAKANPAPLYQALEVVARQRSGVGGRITCIEAGIFPNAAIAEGFSAAQRALAPSVRFVWIDGQDATRYRQAWQGADVFVSLSDNIQETFGLTPVEAMAAGLPVIVSDWDGYRDTVRDGIDGFRIPTILPPSNTGQDLALRHSLGVDTYDFYIGRTSMATVIEPQLLAAACLRLAADPALRQTMGAAGRQRALAEFDWPVILRRYDALALELAELRRVAVAQGASTASHAWPQRADPFARFSHFSSATLSGGWQVAAAPDARKRLDQLLALAMTNYAFGSGMLTSESLISLLEAIISKPAQTVQSVLVSTKLSTPEGVRAFQWLWKLDLIRVTVG